MSEEEENGELTRPPDDHDLVFLSKELNRLGAKYVVIGGVAINRLGFVRATEVLVPLKPAKTSRVPRF